MAQGLLRSNKTRDGIAAVLAENIAYLEDDMYDLREETSDALAAAAEASTASASAVADAESALTEMDAVLESLSLSRASRLNRPNLLKQNYATSREVATGTVVSQDITIPAETAAEAAENLTYTITDSAITSSFKLVGVKSRIYAIASMSNMSAAVSAGSATITVTARNVVDGAATAHDALTVTVYLSLTTTKSVPYGNVNRISGSGYPYLKSISGDASYPGQDETDNVTVDVVSLAAADQITEPDNETYTTALQFNVTANTAYSNTEWLQYYHANYQSGYYQGSTPRNYGHIDELIPGKTYTVSFWGRVTSGTGAWARFGWGGRYGSTPPSANATWGGLSDWVVIEGSAWKRYWWTFTFNPEGTWYTEASSQREVNGETKTYITRTYAWNKSVWFGVGRKLTGVVQLCGFRLVEGGMWLPTKYDELSERFVEMEAEAVETVENIQTNMQGAICETESTTATANHAVGSIFFLNGVLYKATAAIATGETITPGTNCATTTIEAELNAIIAQLGA